jgi:hypothetical protein
MPRIGLPDRECRRSRSAPGASSLARRPRRPMASGPRLHLQIRLAVRRRLRVRAWIFKSRSPAAVAGPGPRVNLQIWPTSGGRRCLRVRAWIVKPARRPRRPEPAQPGSTLRRLSDGISKSEGATGTHLDATVSGPSDSLRRKYDIGRSCPERLAGERSGADRSAEPRSSLRSPRSQGALSGDCQMEFQRARWPSRSGARSRGAVSGAGAAREHSPETARWNVKERGGDRASPGGDRIRSV